MPCIIILQGTTHTEGNVLIDRLMVRAVLILTFKELLFSWEVLYDYQQ